MAKTSAAVSFQIRRIEAQRAHAWYEVFRELSRSMTRNDLGHDLLLDKTPGPIARCAFFLREKLVDAVIIQRCHASESLSHARQFNERTTQRQRCLSALVRSVLSSEIEHLSIVKRFDSLTSRSLIPPGFPSMSRLPRPLHSRLRSAALTSLAITNGNCAKICSAFDCVYFVVGKPAAFQALKPPAIERTFL